MHTRALFPLGLLLLLSLLLSGCGAGGANIDDSGNNSTLNLSDWAARNHGSPAPLTGGDMPAFPVEDSGRGVSDNASHSVLGADYLLAHRCVEIGDALQINDGDIPPGARPIGWAEYQIGGLSGLHAVSLNVECPPQGIDQEYFVALADFSSMSWKWFGGSSLPETQIDLSQDNSRYISNLGNLYFVVLCHGQDVAVHSQSTVVTGQGGGNNLPGAPHGLYASKGEFPDGVALTWQPGPGADLYEIERRDVYAFPDENGQGAVGEWMPLGIAQTTEYFDANLPPGIPFDYRVRSVNQNGHSAWSNIDQGFAFGPPPPGGDYPLQGNVWGLGEGNNPDGQMEMFPLAGALLNIANNENNILVTATSDENGYYFVPQLPPGNYTISCVLDPWSFEPAQAFFSLGPNQPGAWIDFVGSNGGGGGGNGQGITGYVYGVEQGDPNTQQIPLEGALISVIGENGQVILTTTSNPNGWYQILQLPPGTYVLQCSAEGWQFNDSFTFQVGQQMPDIQFDFWGYPAQ